MNFITITKFAIREERAKNYTKAFNLYANAISFPGVQNFTKVKLKSRQGWCLHYVGNHKQALETFQNLFKEHPDEPRSYVCFANYLQKTDKLKQTKAILRKGIEKFPEFLELYLVLASLLKDMERSNEAIDVLKKALSQEHLTKGNGIGRKDIWAELGYLYYERANYNSCIVALKKSMRLSNEDEFLHYDLLARAYLKINDPMNTLRYIDKRIQKFGDYDPDDLIIKARAHARLGEYQYATANLLQAYSIEDCLILKNEDMVDFSFLVQSGFFDTLDNFEFDEG